MKISLIISALTLACCCVMAQEANDYDNAGDFTYTELTHDQIARFLKLSGGNFSYKYSEPVYLNVKMIWKDGMGGEEKHWLDVWSEHTSDQFDFELMVHDPANGKVQRSFDLKYTNANTKESSNSGGNIIFKHDLPWYAESMWDWSRSEPPLDQEIELYKLFDSKAPGTTYFKAIIKFSKTRPQDSKCADQRADVKVSGT